VGFSGLIPFVTGLFGLTMLRDQATLARLNWLVFWLAGVRLTVTWTGTTGIVGIVFGVVWLVAGIVARQWIRDRGGPSEPASAGS
jgi:formate hydrogenlyase subunit 3/multisubunit Na+/H+ antiporter MnhD subunit